MKNRPFVLTAALLVGMSPSFVAAQGNAKNRNANYEEQAQSRFEGVDRNNDGRIVRSEWQGSDQSFRQHDWNNDGVLTGDEMRPGASRYDAARDRDYDNYDSFAFMDHNGDKRVSRSEWTGSIVQFDRLDANNDNVLSRNERLATAASSKTSAYRAGYRQGQVEGRQAGVGDRQSRRGWDLNNQRELRSANSGYDSKVGSLTDFQAGYREGFRAAYPEGFRG